MGGKTETTTKSRTDPAKWLMPHISTVLGGARNLYGGAGGVPAGTPGGFGRSGGFIGGLFNAFGSRMGLHGGGGGMAGDPRSTVAGFSPTTERALSGFEERAAQGSPVFDAGQQSLMDTLGGEYLTPESNPYLREYGDALSGHIQDRVNAEFSKAGRYGSGAHAGTTAREVGDVLSRLYGGAYENERSRMFGAIPQALPFANQDYRDLQAMLGAGQQRDVLAQRQLDEPYEQIQRYLNIIRGVPQGTQSFGKQTQTTTPGALDILGTVGSIAAIPMTGGASALGAAGGSSLLGSLLG